MWKKARKNVFSSLKDQMKKKKICSFLLEYSGWILFDLNVSQSALSTHHATFNSNIGSHVKILKFLILIFNRRLNYKFLSFGDKAL